jgi:hypothetical protein
MVPSSYCLSPFFFFSPPLLLPHRLHISIDALAIGGWNPQPPVGSAPVSETCISLSIEICIHNNLRGVTSDVTWRCHIECSDSNNKTNYRSPR